MLCVIIQQTGFQKFCNTTQKVYLFSAPVVAQRAVHAKVKPIPSSPTNVTTVLVFITFEFSQIKTESWAREVCVLGVGEGGKRGPVVWGLELLSGISFVV